MVEIFSGIITRQVICGTFTSVKDLIAAIGIFIDGWNDRCEPFVWTKTADQIIPSATRSKDTSRAGSLGTWIALLRQQWRGAKLPSIFTGPGCSTTSIDHPSSVGRMQPVEADKYPDQCTRTT